MLPPVASRFVAGESAAVALDHARRVNDDGVGVILNLLGEHYHDRVDADEDAAAYRRLLADIAGSDLRARISVKPSQLGLAIDREVFAENYRSLVEDAVERDVFVWCDMEDASTTDATLGVVESVAEAVGGGVGVCLQANLRRTPEDLRRLAEVPCAVRLVKGAYDEPPAVAHQSKAAVDEAYRENLEFLFREFDGGIAVGSHDPAMIAHAEGLGQEYGRAFEIQMLMGVREAAQRELAARGHDVWQYAPYGRRWLRYFYRRVRERRQNLEFAVRAILGGA
ncbi:MAG: proline dehydrogenase family protein [Haloferacaceae archaeon]